MILTCTYADRHHSPAGGVGPSGLHVISLYITSHLVAAPHISQDNFIYTPSNVNIRCILLLKANSGAKKKKKKGVVNLCCN